MLFSSPFFRRLFLPYLLVICAAIAAVGFFAARSMRDSYLQRSRQALSDQSREVAELIREPLAQGNTARVQELIATLHKEGDCRVTVIDSAGTVVADNEADPRQMENHANRPEILEAGGTGEGGSIRPSATLHQSLFYFARKIDLTVNGKPTTYYVRLAQHLATLDAQIHALYAGLTFVALGAMAAAALISFALARRDTRPVIEIAAFANAVAKGDLSRRYLQPETGEAAALAGALNGMADSLSRLLSRTAEDNARLLAMLGSMNEGVIATDTQQHILFTNASAGRLLGFGDSPADGDVNGQLLWEVVRSDAILKLARDVLSPAPLTTHVDAESNGNGDRHSDLAVAPVPLVLGRKTIHVGPLLGRHLEVTASTFPAAPGPPQGLILVAHDTTQSVQYQELRKEFVANVSHELRTPLSIIKGFAETLRDGAMADPVRGVQYLNTIEKHADQLTNLVSDLLELSRLDSQVGLTRKAPVNLAAIVRRVGESLQPVAQRKRHTLALDVPSDLPELYGNADYLDRAVTNLIDNAIKYTPEGGRVTVVARHEDDAPTTPGALTIEVSDNGIGIPAAELPRIFERFYRVDRSRSRELGGTGLGLSIVKHVAQVHGGHVEVDSTPGKGSTFRLRLPLARATAYAAAE